MHRIINLLILKKDVFFGKGHLPWFQLWQTNRITQQYVRLQP